MDNLKAERQHTDLQSRVTHTHFVTSPQRHLVYGGTLISVSTSFYNFPFLSSWRQSLAVNPAVLKAFCWNLKVSLMLCDWQINSHILWRVNCGRTDWCAPQHPTDAFLFACKLIVGSNCVFLSERLHVWMWQWRKADWQMVGWVALSRNAFKQLEYKYNFIYI